MKFTNDQPTTLRKRKECKMWTESQKKRFLTFLITHRHKFQRKASPQLIQELKNFVDSQKNYTQTLDFLKNKRRKCSSHESLIQSLAAELNLDETWIEERKKRSNYVQVKSLQQLFNPIESLPSFEAETLNILLRTLNPSELQFEIESSDKGNRVKQEQRSYSYEEPFFSNYETIDLIPQKRHSFSKKEIKKQLQGLQVLEVSQNQNVQLQIKQNNLAEQSFQDKKQTKTTSKLKTRIRRQTIYWDDLSKLRLLVFIVAYKQYLKKEYRKDKQRIFVRMSNFIGNNRNNHTCYFFYSRYLSGENSVENVIENLKYEIYANKQEVEREVKRVQEFYYQDRQKQLNSLMAKKCLIEEPTEYVLQLILKTFKTEISKNFNQFFGTQKIVGKDSVPYYLNSDKNDVIEQESKKISASCQISIPIELKLVFSHEQRAQKVEKEDMNVNQREPQSQQKLLRDDLYKDFKYMFQDGYKLSPQYGLNPGYFYVPKGPEPIKQEAIELQYNWHRPYQSSQDNFLNPTSYQNHDPILMHEQGQNDSNDIKSDKNQIKLEYDEVKVEQGEQVNQNQIIKPKLNVTNFEEKLRKKTALWTVSEHVKFIIYLIINRNKFIQTTRRSPQKVWKKLVDWIGTDKTVLKCQNRFHEWKSAHGGDFNKLIYTEVKRLGIKLEDIQRRNQVCKNKKTFTFVQNQIMVMVQTFPISIQRTDDLKQMIKSILDNDFQIKVNILKRIQSQYIKKEQIESDQDDSKSRKQRQNQKDPVIRMTMSFKSHFMNSQLIQFQKQIFKFKQDFVYKFT